MTWVERILATGCTSHGVGAGNWCRQPLNKPGKSYVCASRIAAAEGAAEPGERPAPASGQVWNWEDVGQWRETTLIRHEDSGEHPGWVGRGTDGTLGFFWEDGWDKEMTFVRHPDACPGRKSGPPEHAPAVCRHPSWADNGLCHTCGQHTGRKNRP